jgi:hypothetical protein
MAGTSHAPSMPTTRWTPSSPNRSTRAWPLVSMPWRAWGTSSRRLGFPTPRLSRAGCSTYSAGGRDMGAFGSVLRCRSRTQTGLGGLAFRALKIGRSAVRPRPWSPPSPAETSAQADYVSLVVPLGVQRSAAPLTCLCCPPPTDIHRSGWPARRQDPCHHLCRRR